MGGGLGIPYRKGLGLAGSLVAMVHLFLCKEKCLFWEGVWFVNFGCRAIIFEYINCVQWVRPF